MSKPTMALGTPGNLANNVAVAHGATIAAFLDLSQVWEGQVVVEMTTGGTPPTVGTTFGAYKVYGNQSQNTLSSAVGSAGATSISVASSAGLHVGQKIALVAAGSKVGEVVTITGAITGTGPYSVPVSATINTYAIGDYVLLIAQAPTYSETPASITGTFAASTDYSAPMALGTSQWVIAANNADSAQSVTVSMSYDEVTQYQ